MITNRLQTGRFDDFTPVPRRTHCGGWSPGRQRGFIIALAATGSVARAAAAVKMSKTGAYNLRAARGAEGFARAWDAAVDAGVSALKSLAFERAVEGYDEPVWYKGKQVGVVRRHDNMMLTRLLAIYHTQRAGQASEPPPFDRAVMIEKLKAICRQQAQASDARERAERAEGQLLLGFDGAGPA